MRIEWIWNRQLQSIGSTVVLLIAVACVSVGTELNRIRRQAHAVSMIERLGGSVVYDYQFSKSGAYIRNPIPPGSRWLQKLLGKNYAANVTQVHSHWLIALLDKQVNLDDEMAKELSIVTEVTWMDLTDTRLSDAGLEHFKGLKKLERLDLVGTLVTENGARLFQQSMPTVIVTGGDLKKDEEFYLEPLRKRLPDKP